MKLIIVLLLSVATVHSEQILPNKFARFELRNPLGYIVGGEETDIADIPWQLSLQYDNYGHFCGGVIISDEWGLTAGNCLDTLTASAISVRAGSNYHEVGGVEFRVLEYVIHPEYFLASFYDMDVAVFRINGTFSGEFVEKIQVTDEEPEIGTELLVSGWGKSAMDGNFSDVLQSVVIPLIDRSICNETYEGYITENMICAGETGRDVCRGDRGGPIVDNNIRILIGIISFDFGCGDEGQPSFNVNIAAPAVRSFIREYTGV